MTVMTKTIAAGIAQTKISPKVLTAVLLLVIAASTYVLAANFLIRNQKVELKIWSSGPNQSNIVVGKNLELGGFDLESTLPETVYVRNIIFSTKIVGNYDIRDKVRTLRLVIYHDCGYGYQGQADTCYTELASVPNLDNSGKVSFFDLPLALNPNQTIKLMIRGDIQNFDRTKKGRLMFYINDPSQVTAGVWRWGTGGGGYGYGYEHPVWTPIIANIKKALRGTSLIVSPVPGYGYQQ